MVLVDSFATYQIGSHGKDKKGRVKKTRCQSQTELFTEVHIVFLMCLLSFIFDKIFFKLICLIGKGTV